MKRLLIICLFWFSLSDADVILNEVVPGTKTLRLSFIDSIKQIDLSQVEVEGYSIENAVFIENKDPNLPTRFQAGVVDFSTQPNYKVISVSDGVLDVETPSHHRWISGQLLVDTLGTKGLRLKILSAEEVSQFGDLSRWKLKGVPAQIEEIIAQCDITFTSRPTIDMKLAEGFWKDSSNAVLGSVVPAHTVKLQKTSIHSTPLVKGRFRMVNGVIEVYEFSLDGAFDIEGKVISTTTTGAKREFKLSLPLEMSHHIPLEPGLSLNFSVSAELFVAVNNDKDAASNSLEFNYSQEYSTEMNYLQNQWVSDRSHLGMVSHRANWNPGDEEAVSGRTKISFLPQMHLEIPGLKQVRLQMESFVSSYRSPNFVGSMNNMMSLGGKLHEISKPGQPSEWAMNESVIDAPPKNLVSIEDKRVYSDSAQFNWFHYPDVQSYAIHKFTPEGWEWVDSLATGPLKLRELVPNTDYTFRIIPQNTMGIGVPIIVELRTPKRNNLPNAPNLVFPSEYMHKDTVLLGWEGSDLDTGDVLFYALLLDTVTPPAKEVPLENKSANRYRFVGESGKKYYWQVRVSDSKGYTHSSVWEFEMEKREPVIPNPPDYLKDRVVYIPGGTFQHPTGKKVGVKAFFLNKFEVTQEEYQKWMGKNPSFRKGNNLPVDNVTWNEANQYCTELQGRLPTEAEWEYAARAETESDYYWKNGKIEEHAWYFENSENQTHPVGLKKPNPWGLYDMSGNVFEWVHDWYDPKATTNRDEGFAKVTRGGSWYSDAASLKSSARFKNRPSFASYKLGFRCAFDVKDYSFLEAPVPFVEKPVEEFSLSDQ